MENEIEEAVRGMTPGFPIKATEQIRVLLITECKREREKESRHGEDDKFKPEHTTPEVSGDRPGKDIPQRWS